MALIAGTAVTTALAYVLRQLEPGGRWFVVDRAGRSRLRNREGVPAARPAVDGADPLTAMRSSALVRTRHCEDRYRRAVAAAEQRGERPPPEPWIMFAEVAHAGVGRYHLGVAYQCDTG